MLPVIEMEKPIECFILLNIKMVILYDILFPN